MTVRATLLGLLAAIFIATVGYWNDQVPRTTYFVGNHFPIVIFAPLVLIAIFFRPMFRLPGRRWNGRELAVVVALALVGCNIPGSGLLRFFSRNVAMPSVMRLTSPGWDTARAFDYVPSRLLANDGKYDPALNNDLLRGLGAPDKPIGLKQVPWRFWRTPMESWLPIVALVGIASICLALMVHRTWAMSERLPFPIAAFANTLLEEPGPGASPFRMRGFWVAALGILAIHLVNGANLYLDKKYISIPMSFDISPLLVTFPSLGRGAYVWSALQSISFWPTAVAFAALIASDVSLAIGISPLALAFVTGVLFTAGIDTSGDTMNGGFLQWQQAGSYFAVAVMILYFGRRTYLQTFRAAFAPGGRGGVPAYEVWACRGLLLAMAALTAWLAWLGLAWTLAIVLVVLLLINQLVIARINAESGLILAEVAWQPIAVMIGLFGAKALGLSGIVIVSMIVVQFTLNSRECLMPFVLNGLQLCRLRDVPTGRVAGAGVAVLLAAIAAGVGCGLWVDYNYGLAKGESFPVNLAPRRPFDTLVRYHEKLERTDAVQASRNLTPLQRLASIEPDTRCLWWLGIGAAAVFLVYALRLRLPWWPLHPILFLFWGTWAMSAFCWSFLAGWAIKGALARMPIPRVRVRAVLVGIIAGDLLGGMVWMIVGAIYYVVKNVPPPRYLVFPGG